MSTSTDTVTFGAIYHLYPAQKVSNSGTNKTTLFVHHIIQQEEKSPFSCGFLVYAVDSPVKPCTDQVLSKRRGAQAFQWDLVVDPFLRRRIFLECEYLPLAVPVL